MSTPNPTTTTPLITSSSSFSAATAQNTISSPLHLLILVPSSSSPSPSPSSSSTAPPHLSTPPPSHLLLPPFLRALTSHTPPPIHAPSSSFAGYTSHPPLKLRTRYYDADVPIWVDEVPGPGPTTEGEGEGEGVTVQTWREQMVSREAAEVRGAVGAVVVVLEIGEVATGEGDDYSYIVELLAAVGEVRDEIEATRLGGECAACVVLQDTSTRKDGSGDRGVAEGGSTRGEGDAALVEGFEEMLLGQGILGWDVVAWDGVVAPAPDPPAASGDGEKDGERNAYGEKMGLSRLMEILEAVEWASHPTDGGDEEEDDPALAFLSAAGAGVGGHGEGGSGAEDGDEDALKLSEQELQREMLGLSLAIREQSRRGEDGVEEEGEEDEAAKVDALPGLMERVMAMREKGVGMEGEERERWARRAVGELMKEL